MDIEVEFAFEVVGAELSKAVRFVLALVATTEKMLPAYCASSQVTIGERSIFHIRVKKAKAVNMRGAMNGSSSSQVVRADWACSPCQLNVLDVQL
jgi:hypothetical protein